MTRKIVLIALLTVVLIACCVPTVALANSAAPDYTGVGSGVTFDTYYDVQVDSEVLDIVFDNRTATVTATYVMTNLTSSQLEIDTMFILPAKDAGKGYMCSIWQDNNVLSYTVSTYTYADYNTTLTLDDWQYIVENGYESDEYDDYLLQIGAVSYVMSFAPNATSTIVVSYETQLGGAVSYSSTVELLYYLTPAQYWADFASLTINLTLDDNHPTLDKGSTSLKFTKTGDYTYQYTSDTLPDTELTVVAQESLWDRLSTNAVIMLVFFGIPALIVCTVLSVLVVGTILIVRAVKYSKKSLSVKPKSYYRNRVIAILIVLAVLIVLSVLAVVLNAVAEAFFSIMLIVDIVGGLALLDYAILLLDSGLRNRRNSRKQSIDVAE